MGGKQHNSLHFLCFDPRAASANDALSFQFALNTLSKTSSIAFRHRAAAEKELEPRMQPESQAAPDDYSSYYPEPALNAFPKTNSWTWS